jgi:hypothetical protein
MSEQAATFPDLAKDFAAAVKDAKKDASALPFVSLQYSALLNHKAETDDDKHKLTGLMSGLATHWLAYCSRPEYSGEFGNADRLLHPMLDALQGQQALPFVQPDTTQKITDACIALALNGPALLKKAGPRDDDASSVALKNGNREALLGLTQRALEFVDKCKEFREGMNFDPKTSKDITPVKRIELRAGTSPGG